MSKNNKPVDEQTQQPTETQHTAESGSPAFLKELQEKGTTTLTADSREALAEMVNTIPAEVSYAVGAVGYNAETRLFSLHIDLTNK